MHQNSATHYPRLTANFTFSDLLLSIQEVNIQELRRFFPLRIYQPIQRYFDKDGIKEMRLSYLGWFKYPAKKTYSVVNIKKEIAIIEKELFNPLFNESFINVKKEDRPLDHQNDNYHCCLRGLIWDLRKLKYNPLYRDRLVSERKVYAENEFKKAIVKYCKNLKNIIPNSSDINTQYLRALSDKDLDYAKRAAKEIKKELKEAKGTINRIKEEGNLFNGVDDMLTWIKEKNINEIVWLFEHLITIYKNFNPAKIEDLDKLIEKIVSRRDYVKASQGKPGRHPTFFDAFVYHLTNKYTFRQFDKNRNYIEEDGQYKLKKEWDLICFLLLWIHVHIRPFEKLDEFIKTHKNESASEALFDLKRKLGGRYSNFKPKEGWPFQGKIDETGFRKLIVTDDGTLRIIML